MDDIVRISATDRDQDITAIGAVHRQYHHIILARLSRDIDKGVRRITESGAVIGEELRPATHTTRTREEAAKARLAGHRHIAGIGNGRKKGQFFVWRTGSRIGQNRPTNGALRKNSCR